jgi:hypothetical protein
MAWKFEDFKWDKEELGWMIHAAPHTHSGTVGKRKIFILMHCNLISASTMLTTDQESKTSRGGPHRIPLLPACGSDLWRLHHNIGPPFSGTSPC